MKVKSGVVLLLLSAMAVTEAAAALSLDVCLSCHANATCDDKSDGSGKVCNCKYGFVGNGRTFCQDKDECQIGSLKICGQHTTCHNTYGSYYCTCLSGYRPSNNMATFIPNDGTNCQDIDECQVDGVCGEGAVCKNLEGSFDCRCETGYRVHDGAEPFHPHRDTATCKVVDCGRPVLPEDAVLVSLTKQTFGGVAVFKCDEGFIWRRGDNSSVCGARGQWTAPSVVCEAKCGPLPVLAHTEVVWHNRSVVIHRCVRGFHSWTGSDTSTCDGSSGGWNKATITCTEIKPPISHLQVLNERCLHWKAEKYEEATEIYKVIFTGSRDYQTAFVDKRKRVLSSKADRVDVCLNLLPVTNYSISVTATTARFTATVVTNTSLTVPPVPVVHYREFETPVPTLTLHRSANTLDPISVYQIFVLPVEGLLVFDCFSPTFSSDQHRTHYITAQIQLKDVGTDMTFTVGDGRFYTGFLNEPLENGKDYYIILRAVSEWRKEIKSSCILWAKVKGSSYVLTVSSLSAAAVVGLVALVSFGGYSYFRLFKT
ncbi:hypothetical protein WMY93_004195 [Mugilogobius chulae]|uniref:Sushi domain containing 1 n=1 Tax=Mugilogobius chulae TaxID=88201 RepID=A0AAW0PQD9_9GOBI